jgi:hypothetical protein
MQGFVHDIGAVMHAATVVVGDQLGLCKALAKGPATSREFATRTDLHLHPRLALAGGRPLPGRPGRREAPARGGHDRRRLAHSGVMPAPLISFSIRA